MYGVFFHIDAFFVSEKCVATPNFLFGYQELLLSSAFSVHMYCSFKPRKNIPVLVGATRWKPG